ncbi:MAG: GAF domain-containing protein [Spirochaetales bacterium]|nr:MAG: GAF domain-containing protein [Spirochaetales bacterium]
MRNDGERRDPLRRFLDRERKDRINACIEEINGCGVYRELLETVLNRTMEICGARSGGIFITDPDMAIPRLLAHRAVDGGEFEYSRHVLEECFAGRKAVITTSAEESDEFSPYRSVSASGLKSIMCLPLRHNERTMGACYLDNSLAAGVFCPDDARLLDLFLSSASVLVENAQLCEKANRAAPAPASDEAALGKRHAARAVAYRKKL